MEVDLNKYRNTRYKKTVFKYLPIFGKECVNSTLDIDTFCH